MKINTSLIELVIDLASDQTADFSALLRTVHTLNLPKPLGEQIAVLYELDEDNRLNDPQAWEELGVPYKYVAIINAIRNANVTGRSRSEIKAEMIKLINIMLSIDSKLSSAFVSATATLGAATLLGLGIFKFMGRTVVQTAATMQKIAHADPLSRVPPGLKQLFPLLKMANNLSWIVWIGIMLVASVVITKLSVILINGIIRATNAKIYKKITYYEFLSTFTANWLIAKAWDVALEKTAGEIKDKKLQEILYQFLSVRSLEELSPLLRNIAMYSLRGVILFMSLYRNNLTPEDMIKKTTDEGIILESSDLPKMLSAISSAAKLIAMLEITLFGMLPYVINIMISLSAI